MLASDLDTNSYVILSVRVIVHVIDMSGLEGRDPYEDYVTINNELKEYNLRLTERPQVVVANKMDMPDAEENLQAFKEKVGDEVKSSQSQL